MNFPPRTGREESKELLSPERYFVLMKKEAEEEVNKT